jgi:hypothetical protein
MKEIPGSAERKEEATPARAEDNKHENGDANDIAFFSCLRGGWQVVAPGK